MMADDGGGYGFRDSKDREIHDLKRKVSDLERENLDMISQIREFNQAPLRRMVEGFKNFWKEWFGVAIILTIIASGIGAAYHGSNVRAERLRGSCEFAAKIQDTKFEFDKYNDKCYIYDKKAEKYVTNSTQAP